MTTTTRTLRVDDPYTGEIACEVPVSTPPEVARALARAAEAQLAFARASVRERVALVLALADALTAGREEAAREVTRAMGKPVRESRQEVEIAAERVRALAALAEEALAHRRLPRRCGDDRFVSRDPLGVVLQLAPWNEPLLATVNVLVPAVLAGNAVLVKPSSRTPQSSARLAGAFAKAGAPPGLVQSLVMDRDTVAELMGRAEVGLVAFTGMANAAREVHRTASMCFRHVVLQVFGKDCAYVAEDADLDRAAESIAISAFSNAGQGCSSVQRVYVDGAVEEPFLERLVAAAKRFVPDDPMADSTTLGPLAKADLPGAAARAIAEARAQEGLLLCGSARDTVDGRGRFYPATVIAAATHRMTLMNERVLAPVVGVMRVDGDRSALRLMNDSPHVLTASVWTRSDERALAMGGELRVGTVCQNHCISVDADLPWTGVGESGLASSISSPGFLELTRPKSFHLRRGG
jgi:acyl-CoA reductase-like NAD-dependent aldehyde dehydrogenase